MSKVKRRLHKLVYVYACQNATLLEITCCGSNSLHVRLRYVSHCRRASMHSDTLHVRHNRNCLGQFREIPWIQTTDVQRGSTLMTRVKYVPLALYNVTLTSQKPPLHKNKCDCGKTKGLNEVYVVVFFNKISQ